MIAAKAYSADEVRRAYERAVALSHRAGSPDQRFAALRGLWNNHLMRVELRTAKELVQHLRAIAQRSGDPEVQTSIAQQEMERALADR